MRTLFEVCDRILEIAGDEEYFEPLIVSIRKVRYDASYHPPELMGDDWFRLTNVVNTKINTRNPSEKEIEILAYFCDVSVDEFKSWLNGEED
jgi:hypothetical protein